MKYWKQMISMTFGFISTSWTSSFVSASKFLWECLLVLLPKLQHHTKRNCVSPVASLCLNWMWWGRKNGSTEIIKDNKQTTHLSIAVSLLAAHNNKHRERPLCSVLWVNCSCKTFFKNKLVRQTHKDVMLPKSNIVLFSVYVKYNIFCKNWQTLLYCVLYLYYHLKVWGL